MTNFERFQCWDQVRLGQVINKEAIAVDLPDFLATHAPLGQISYVRAGSSETVGEKELLDELVLKALNDQHVFSIIQGIPGTGKSHLIRWLHQRYLVESAGQDEVVLIERAQNSLLGTLRQIIDKIDIGSEALRQQIEKLRSATNTLSDRALKDSILDSLRVATYEHGEPPKGKIKRGIEGFLLDTAIRAMLQADGGPVDRIAAFLTSGQRGAGGDRPEFVADDFKLRAEVLRDVTNHARQEARDLANALDLKEDLREELAGYLNRQLDYAISRTVVLSASDLQQTFNDLRRELRRRGKGLALFIEDITAFTGIDLGLIDVLATQHTGEANREFCRLTSVVGITDSYFRDRFPDNLRQRVTHHLTLNVGPADQPEAGLLHNPAATADLAARYLNAIRADRAAIRGWFEDGANIQHLPNRCEECPHHDPCHAAFGAVNIGDRDGIPVEVGLYPFNERMLWGAYTRLDKTTVSRTPRSLLNNVILDVLQTHGLGIIGGSFPPPARELVPAVHERNLPALSKPVQQRVVAAQGGADAARIQSLVLFWGDGTVDARDEGGAQTVGLLSPAVFRAFSLPPIPGVPADAAVPVDIPPPPVQVPTGNVPQLPHEAVAPEGSAKPEAPQPISPPGFGLRQRPVREGTKYDADLERWRTGSKLEQYEDLRRFLVDFIEASIDWTLHGVSAGVVDERIKPGRFEIEGQAGRAVGERLLLPRSDELYYVLQALAELNATGGQVPSEALGAHLVTLGSWLRKNEEVIVAHVLRPTREQASPMPLVELLALDCLLLEVLCDNLKGDATTPADLLRAILSSAGVEVSDRPSTDQDWANQIERAKAVHSGAWTGLMRTIGGQRARTCRSQLLKQLNQPQGRSSDIRFIDAATALDVLARMRKRDWALSPIQEIDDRASATWRSAGEVYLKVAERLDALLEEERAHQRLLLERLRELTGDASPDEVVRAVEGILADLRDYGIPHSLGELPAKGPGMRNMLQYFATTVEEKDRGASAVRLSAGTRYVQLAVEFASYLGKVKERASQVAEQQRRIIADLESASDALRLEEGALALYDEILALLREPTPAAEPLEVQP
jgi:hypothetical protein